MTPAQLNTHINYLAGTNDTTFTQASKLPIVNLGKNEIASAIVQRAPSYFLIPAGFSLVADQREYGLADDILNVLTNKVEIAFATADNRQPATYLKDYRGSEAENEIIKEFTNLEGEFAFTIRRRSIFILSGTIVASTYSASTGGVRYLANIYPADLANLTSATDMSTDPSTTSFGFPRQFHELLARWVARQYKSRNNKKLSELDLRYDADLELQLAGIANTEATGQTKGNLPSGADLWDNGANL